MKCCSSAILVTTELFVSKTFAMLENHSKRSHFEEFLDFIKMFLIFGHPMFHSHILLTSVILKKKGKNPSLLITAKQYIMQQMKNKAYVLYIISVSFAWKVLDFRQKIMGRRKLSIIGFVSSRMWEKNWKYFAVHLLAKISWKMGSQQTY